VLTDEPDRRAGVPRADVDEQLAGLRPEFGERFEERLLAERLEAVLQLDVERILVRPELAVKLLDRRLHFIERGEDLAPRPGESA
jgi:hypothetical protein